MRLDQLDLSALPPGAGARLDRFARAFERLDVASHTLFATRPEDEAEVAAAIERADEALGPEPRRATAWDTAGAFVDWAAQGYSRRLPLSDTLLLFQSVPDLPEDRVAFARNLEAALIGLIAWDLIGDEDLATLLGPFADMAEAAATG